MRRCRYCAVWSSAIWSRPDCSARSGASWSSGWFVNAISASLITTFVYGGATGVNGTSVLTATLVVAMKDILASVISSSLIENLLDKGITVAIAWVIVQKIPRRFLSQYAADSMGGSDNDALSDDDEEEDE